jgi:hypothetical protein
VAEILLHRDGTLPAAHARIGIVRPRRAAPRRRSCSFYFVDRRVRRTLLGRLSQPLVWFATLGSMACYLILCAYYALGRASGWTKYIRERPNWRIPARDRSEHGSSSLGAAGQLAGQGGGRQMAAGWWIGYPSHGRRSKPTRKIGGRGSERVVPQTRQLPRLPAGCSSSPGRFARASEPARLVSRADRKSRTRSPPAPQLDDRAAFRPFRPRQLTARPAPPPRCSPARDEEISRDLVGSARNLAAGRIAARSAGGNRECGSRVRPRARSPVPLIIIGLAIGFVVLQLLPQPVIGHRRRALAIVDGRIPCSVAEFAFAAGFVGAVGICGPRSSGSASRKSTAANLYHNRLLGVTLRRLAAARRGARTFLGGRPGQEAASDADT